MNESLSWFSHFLQRCKLTRPDRLSMQNCKCEEFTSHTSTTKDFQKPAHERKLHFWWWWRWWWLPFPIKISQGDTSSQSSPPLAPIDAVHWHVQFQKTVKLYIDFWLQDLFCQFVPDIQFHSLGSASDRTSSEKKGQNLLDFTLLRFGSHFYSLLCLPCPRLLLSKINVFIFSFPQLNGLHLTSLQALWFIK